MKYNFGSEHLSCVILYIVQFPLPKYWNAAKDRLEVNNVRRYDIFSIVIRQSNDALLKRRSLLKFIVVCL